MQAKLIPLSGGAPIELDRDVTVVGRKRGVCDVILDLNSISKLHCMIVKTDGLLFVRDLGSTNGTKVNGQRVIRGALLPGDELAFASAKFQVHLGPSESAPAVSESPELTEMMPGIENAPVFEGDELIELELDDDGEIELEEVASESDVRLLSDDSRHS